MALHHFKKRVPQIQFADELEPTPEDKFRKVSTFLITINTNKSEEKYRNELRAAVTRIFQTQAFNWEDGLVKFPEGERWQDLTKRPKLKVGIEQGNKMNRHHAHIVVKLKYLSNHRGAPWWHMDPKFIKQKVTEEMPDVVNPYVHIDWIPDNVQNAQEYAMKYGRRPRYRPVQKIQEKLEEVDTDLVSAGLANLNLD